MTNPDQYQLPELPPIGEVLKLLGDQKQSQGQTQQRPQIISDKKLEIIISLGPSQDLGIEIERINPRLRPYELRLSSDNPSDYGNNLENIRGLTQIYPSGRFNFFRLGVAPYLIKVRKVIDSILMEGNYQEIMAKFNQDFSMIVNKRLLLIDACGEKAWEKELREYKKLILSGVGIGD